MAIDMVLMEELDDERYFQVVNSYLRSWNDILTKEHSPNADLFSIVLSQFQKRNSNAPATQVIALKDGNVVGSISGFPVNENILLKISDEEDSYDKITAQGTFALADFESDCITCVAIQVDPSLRGERIGSKIIDTLKYGFSHQLDSSGVLSEVKVSSSLMYVFETMDIKKIYPYTRLNGLQRFKAWCESQGIRYDEMNTLAKDYLDSIKLREILPLQPEVMKILKSDATYFHFKNGAKQVKICPNGRPQDKDSLGFNNLVCYEI